MHVKVEHGQIQSDKWKEKHRYIRVVEFKFLFAPEKSEGRGEKDLTCNNGIIKRALRANRSNLLKFNTQKREQGVLIYKRGEEEGAMSYLNVLIYFEYI